jgi:uncharacterized protein YjbJ (UPF0337 family)
MQLHAKQLVGLLRRSTTAWLAAMAILTSSMLHPLPAMALAAHHSPGVVLASATTKKVEGQLESAYGEITGDAGHQVKGKAKQIQGSGMKVADNIKQGADSAAKKVADAAGSVGR